MLEEQIERQRYENYRENFRATFDLSGEYAKWFLSTLLLLNSGAIAAIFQRGELVKYGFSVRLFGAGILSALFAGLAGWFNLQWAAHYYHMLAHSMPRHLPEPPYPRSIKVTRYLGIAFALLSVVLLTGGATVIALN